MRVLVVLPTYNEHENIEAILRTVREVVPDAAILVVDDSSPDGTAEIAEKVAVDLGSVEVLRRPAKNGLGPAYRDGFRWGLARGYGAFVEMDSDFSHDPQRAARAPRGPRRRRRARHRLALRPGRLHSELVDLAPSHLASRQHLRQGAPRARRRGLDGGLPRLCGDTAPSARPRPGARRQLRLPDRDDASGAPGRRGDRRGADPLRRPRRRVLEDVDVHGRRGVRARDGVEPASAGPAATSPRLRHGGAACRPDAVRHVDRLTAARLSRDGIAGPESRATPACQPAFPRRSGRVAGRVARAGRRRRGRPGPGWAASAARPGRRSRPGSSSMRCWRDRDRRPY